jgi:hypothetical protein
MPYPEQCYQHVLFRESSRDARSHAMTERQNEIGMDVLLPLITRLQPSFGEELQGVWEVFFHATSNPVLSDENRLGVERDSRIEIDCFKRRLTFFGIS